MGVTLVTGPLQRRCGDVAGWLPRPLLRRSGWVFGRCCVPVSGSSPAAALPRVGLPLRLRSRGWGFDLRLRSRGWGFDLRLRRCGCEAGRSPKGPRPADGSRVGRALGARLRGTQGSAFVREGAKDAALVSGSRRERSIVRASAHEGRILRPPGASPAPGGQGFSLCADRSKQNENPCPYGDLFGATMLPSRGTVHAKEASWVDPAQRENRGRAPQTQPTRAPPLRSRPFSETDPTRSHSDAAASGIPAAPRRPNQPETPRSGRGPFGDHAHSRPQRRSST